MQNYVTVIMNTSKSNLTWEDLKGLSFLITED